MGRARRGDAGRAERAPAGPGAAALLVALALAVPSSGCFLRLGTQRWPGIAEPSVQPLPPGDLGEHPRGPEEVLIQRHADPVQVRPAGALRGFPLTFYNKRLRVNSGSSVVVSPGGRAEVLWPVGTSIVLSGEGVGVVGSPSRGEPSFLFKTVTQSTMYLVPGDQVQLMGGALLSGDAGPYELERVRRDVLRVKNQSKGSLAVAFRQEVFDLAPGHVVDLPLLESGGAPTPGDLGFRRVAGPGFQVGVRGEVDAQEVGGALRVQARDSAELRGLGVHVRLPAGGGAVLSTPGGGGPSPAPAADAPGPAGPPDDPEPPPDASPASAPSPSTPRSVPPERP